MTVLAVGVAMLLGAAIAIGYDVPGLPLWLLVAGGVITVGTLLERVFYKPLLRASPGAGWQKTGERFVDPESGKEVEVFYDPRSGERQYVAHDAKAADRQAEN